MLNNGWVTQKIELGRGLRQGCPLSPYLFILVAEPLAHNIRTNENIKGLKINNKESKLSQYADDTELFVDYNETTLKEIFLTFEKFENISGLKINTDKTEILKIGSAKDKEDLLPHYKCKWTNNIKVLGIEIWSNMNDTLSKNYTKK